LKLFKQYSVMKAHIAIFIALSILYVNAGTAQNVSYTKILDFQYRQHKTSQI